MHYIKDLFDKRETLHTHNKFIRYSKGEFTGPILNIKITKANIKVNSSFHIASELLILMADLLKTKEVEIKGNLSWNEDLNPALERLGIKYLKVIKSRGIFNYVLQNKVNLQDLIKELGNYNLLISFSDQDAKLTTKNKYPKPNKDISGDFCKSTFPTSMKDRVLSEFAFDIKGDDIKDIQISHKIIVSDIILPETNNFDEARRLAKRAGKIIRKISVNGADEKITEIEYAI